MRNTDKPIPVNRIKAVLAEKEVSDKAINTAEPFMFQAKPVIQNMPPVAFK